MSDRVAFITGAGGFIGKYILDHYLEDGVFDLYLLENGPFCDRLNAHLDEIIEDPDHRDRVKVIEGDITIGDLGLDKALYAELTERVTEAIHLAAVYNLAVSEAFAFKVNVDGTQHILDLLAQCKKLKRFGYVSTSYVAGNHKGDFGPKDLNVGQGFKNHYESTKFAAEVLVQERWGDIPTVIFRPTVVVGHSQTGAIQKVDGPYHVLELIDRNLHTVLPKSGPGKADIVPVDFVADSLYYLLGRDSSLGQVFHLGDPNPVTYDAFFDIVCDAWGKRRPLLKLPVKVMLPIVGLKVVEKFLRVPKEAYSYPSHLVNYDVSNTHAALEGSGIRCPHVTEYVKVMIEYFLAHRMDSTVLRGNWQEAKPD